MKHTLHGLQKGSLAFRIITKSEPFNLALVKAFQSNVPDNLKGSPGRFRLLPLPSRASRFRKKNQCMLPSAATFAGTDAAIQARKVLGSWASGRMWYLIRAGRKQEPKTSTGHRQTTLFDKHCEAHGLCALCGV